MTVYGSLLPHQFLTVPDFRDMTEFPTVAARTTNQLGLYLTRAHILLAKYLPYDDQGKLDQYEQEMQVATFLVAESLALANPTRAAAAAGITSESIGKYSYSRAPGGSSTGTGITGDLVPDEALWIIERWSKSDDDAIQVSTTDVFTEAPYNGDGPHGRTYSLGTDIALADAWTSHVGWALPVGPRG